MCKNYARTKLCRRTGTVPKTTHKSTAKSPPKENRRYSITKGTHTFNGTLVVNPMIKNNFSF